MEKKWFRLAIVFLGISFMASPCLAGALDAFDPGANRAALMWRLAWWRKVKNKRQSVRSLFDAEPSPEPPPLPPEDHRQRLLREFGVLGFLCACHQP